jgi:hypothetical protein
MRYLAGFEGDLVDPSTEKEEHVSATPRWNTGRGNICSALKARQVVRDAVLPTQERRTLSVEPSWPRRRRHLREEEGPKFSLQGSERPVSTTRRD